MPRFSSIVLLHIILAPCLGDIRVGLGATPRRRSAAQTLAADGPLAPQAGGPEDEAAAATRRAAGSADEEAAAATRRAAGSADEAPPHSPLVDAWARLRPQQRSLEGFAASATLTTVVVLGLFVTYGKYQTSIESVCGLGLGHVCCICFVVLSVSIDLSIKAAAAGNGGKYSFDPAAAVLVVETCKLLVSTLLFGDVCFRSRRDGAQVQLPSVREAAWLALPGVVYTLDMVILYEAVAKVSLATYAVIRETRLIWAALLWRMVFRLPISRTRWVGMCGILLGCAVNQAPQLLQAGKAGKAIWLAFALAFLTGAAGVINEYALKRTKGVDINLQNMIHYFTGDCCILVYFAAFRPHVFHSAADFFSGFGPPCLQIIILQVFAGLFVSRILKYMEAITEKVLGSFCSPVVVYLGAAIMHVRLNAFQIISPIIVFASCVLYLREGPLCAGDAVSARDKWMLLPAK